MKLENGGRIEIQGEISGQSEIAAVISTDGGGSGGDQHGGTPGGAGSGGTGNGTGGLREMVKFFVVQIKMGNLSVEQVPEKYRAAVEAAYRE